MPSQKQHLSQASHNEKLVSNYKLLDSEFTDWAITALFYSALHYVEAYFATKYNWHHRKHEKRNPAIRRCLPHCYDDYKQLKYDSEEARYNNRRFSIKELGDNIVPDFEKFKANILRHLK